MGISEEDRLAILKASKAPDRIENVMQMIKELFGCPG